MKTKQSSTEYGLAGISERAVDGNRNTRFETKSCTHTFTSDNPWWWVDLGDEFHIHNIVITVRSDYFRRKWEQMNCREQAVNYKKLKQYPAIE